jgi:lycopene cyclase-like protein
MVHPATGYSVGASLQAAPRLATAIAQALERRATPQGVSGAAWSAVWPAWRRRARGLEEYGLAALLRLDQGEVRSFFDAFFGLDDAAWFGYLTGDLGPRDLARVMRDLFASVPREVKAKLVVGSPMPLVRALA